MKKGITLLLAVLISSIVLSVGLALANIVYKEQLLSVTQNDSVRAFYAADAGIECALYWDIHYDDIDRGAPAQPNGQPVFTKNPFPEPGNAYTAYTSPTSDSAKCYGQNLGVNFISYTTPAPSWKDTLPLTAAGSSGKLYISNDTADVGNSAVACAQIKISKKWNDDGNGVVDPGEITTTIESQGYNVCDFTSQRQVERTLVQTYCGLSVCQ